MKTRLIQFAVILVASAGFVWSQATPAAPTEPATPAGPAAPAVAPSTPTPAVNPPAPAPAEKPAVEQPAVEKPASEQPAPKPAVEAPPAEKPAAEKPAAEKPAEPAPAATVQGTEPAGAGVSRTHDTLSVDFPDEDIRTILRNVADLFELNLVIPETLQGKTSIKLRDVTWRQIFEVILTPVGYTYIEQGSIIKVVSLESLAQEPVNTEVFTLSYARAADAQPIISSLVDTSAGGKLVVDARSNSLIITERPSRMNRIRPIIERLDKATDQVMIESKFVEVTNSDIQNLGVNWSSLDNYQVGLLPTNTVIRGGSKVPRDDDGALVVPIPGNASTTFAAVFSGAQFSTFLSALKTISGTRIVSNPTVVTLNNAEAFINVGQEFPIPNYTYNQEHGSFEVSGFTYKPIGIILKVTPQVNARGFIKLTLEPEVSQQNGKVSFGGAAGAEIPIIATRKAKTQVSMKDGYTMAIGGLLSTQTIKGGTKVPVLGSIPVLGRLFSSKADNTQTTNLIIFITAKAINAEGASPEETVNPRQLRDLNLRRDELPGYRESGDPFLPAEPAQAVAPAKS
ncbi:MAG TPA: secretin N-terminal domain-containing protein [Opitutaceae bacterium]|nr:secretin N-terminal domain-containing protein [Opitutaceae bacterium]